MAIKKPIKKPVSKKYFEAIGRRKTAIARVRFYNDQKNKDVTVNGKELIQYFKTKELQEILKEPLNKSGLTSGWKISIKVFGGGLRAQAYAARHGLSRAIVLADPESKKTLKTLGFLTRDPRKKERKKAGLKGARRAPQWSKR